MPAALSLGLASLMTVATVLPIMPVAGAAGSTSTTDPAVDMGFGLILGSVHAEPLGAAINPVDAAVALAPAMPNGAAIQTATLPEPEMKALLEAASGVGLSVAPGAAAAVETAAAGPAAASDRQPITVQTRLQPAASTPANVTRELPGAAASPQPELPALEAGAPMALSHEPAPLTTELSDGDKTEPDDEADPPGQLVVDAPVAASVQQSAPAVPAVTLPATADCQAETSNGPGSSAPASAALVEADVIPTPDLVGGEDASDREGVASASAPAPGSTAPPLGLPRRAETVPASPERLAHLEVAPTSPRASASDDSKPVAPLADAPAAPRASPVSPVGPAQATPTPMTGQVPTQAGARPARSERSKLVSDAESSPPDLVPAARRQPGLLISADAVQKPAAPAEVEPLAAEDFVTEDGELSAASPVDLAMPDEFGAKPADTAASGSPALRGAPETVANLTAQILKKLQSQSTRFNIELTPHGMGKVDVRVEINVHGRITAALTFESPLAAQEVKARAAELQRTLEQAGFDLTGGLTFDVADERGRQQQQAWQDDAAPGNGDRGKAFRAVLGALEGADAPRTDLMWRRGRATGVDVRV